MELLNYIVENRLILIPVLYVIGDFIKKTEYIQDKNIPIVLLLLGVTFSITMSGDTIINNMLQGILVSGATVLGNQLVKQSKKGGE